MKIDEKLGEKFNLETSVTNVPAIIPPAPVVVVETADELETDSQKARTTLNSLIDQSVSALEELIKVAKASENPRAYEVVAQMIKATADISKDLITVQKLKKDARPGDDETPKRAGNIGTQQNIFVGSTNDLLRALNAVRDNPTNMEIPANAEIRSSS